MTEQYDSLNEQTKLFETALKYTDGDIEKAKAMVAGQYNDVTVVKGKFVIGDKAESGIFLIFVNIKDEYISKIILVNSYNSSIFDKVRIFDDWKGLYNDSMAFSRGNDVIDSQEFSDHLLDSVIKHDIFLEVEEENLGELVRKLNQIIKEFYNIDELQCQIDIDNLSSLAIELIGIIIDLPAGMDSGAGEESQEKPGDDLSAEDARITKIEAEANYLVSGSIIVAPVSGKYVNDINLGELIKVLLTGKDNVTKKLLSVLNATKEDGSTSPVKGRLKAKIPLEKGGYILYALVAKGVLAKIVEEENVKIQIDSSVKDEVKKSKSDNVIMYILAVLIALVVISAIILFQVL